MIAAAAQVKNSGLGIRENFPFTGQRQKRTCAPRDALRFSYSLGGTIMILGVECESLATLCTRRDFVDGVK